MSSTTNEDVVAVLEEAMDEGLQVSLEYDGLLRVVEPHTIGVTNTGKTCVRVYQTEGSSLSGGEIPGWRLMNVSKIYKLPTILDIKSLSPREEYKKNDSAMVYIMKEL